jgi:hypothetical protein
MSKYSANGVAHIHSYFSSGGDILDFYRDNASTQLAFGESGTGLDVKFYGDTVSAWVLWDESADSLLFSSTAKLAIGGTFTASGDVTFSGANFNVTGASTLIGNASTDKIAFFGATPRVQGTFTATSAVTSTIAINVLEFLQAVGLMTATG